MSAVEDLREELEAMIRQRVGGAYRFGLAAMGSRGGAPLGYPNENRDVAEVLAAVDAWAKAKRPRVRAKPAEKKPPAVHYDPELAGRPACVPVDRIHGRGWKVSRLPERVTCGHCLKTPAYHQAASGGGDP